MKLEYRNIKNESLLVLTNFNCDPSQQLLKDKDLYKILWCKGNHTDLTVDGYQLSLKKDQVLFCTPLNVLTIPQENDLIAIVFNREFYCIRDHDDEVSCSGLLFYGSSTPPIIDLCEKDQKNFESMFHLFKSEFEVKDHIQGEMLRVMLKRILITSSRLIKNNLPDPEISKSHLDIIRQYHLLVEQNFKEKHKVANYADLLFKSPKTLSNLFKKTGDKSPLRVINERIALEAKRLLLYSDKTAEEIAYELGYNEPAHFSKFFKNQVGYPPSAFKKEFKAKVKSPS